MIIGVNGPKGPAATDKAKAKGKTDSVGGPSFADLLQEASGVDEAPAPSAAGGVGLGGAFIPVEGEIPQDARGRARELMKTLKDLAEDTYAGNTTATAGRLEALASDLDSADLSAAQKQVLDEVRTRAAVEVAKLKS